jgi:hypothetical protein
LEDSIRLIDNSSYLQCKLEVVDDTHNLKSLTANDYKYIFFFFIKKKEFFFEMCLREFIDEAFYKAREHVLESIENKTESAKVPYKPYHYRSCEIDPSFFCISTEMCNKEKSKTTEKDEQNKDTEQDDSMINTFASFQENILDPYTKPL